MAEKKKIFSESDFDKDKQLFTSEDFEKNKGVGKDSENPTATPSTKSRVVVWPVIGFAIFAGIYFLWVKGSDSGQQSTIEGTVEQVTGGNPPEAASTGNSFASGAKNGNGVAETAENSLVIEPGNEKVQANQTAAQPTVEISNVGSSAQKQKPKVTVTKSQTAQVNDNSAIVSGNVTENAIRVIRGDFGNGQERMDKLGSAYSEIQNKVNEMYKNGLVK